MHWFDTECGILFGSNEAQLRDSKMIRTENRGQTWAEIPLPFNGPLNESSVVDITFSDQQYGFAVGQGGSIFTTEDSGLTWSLANQGYPQFYSMDFMTDEIRYASTGRGYFTTVDGGLTGDYVLGSESTLIIDMDITPQRGVFAGRGNQVHILDPLTDSLETVTLPVSFLVMYYIGQTEDTLFAAGRAVAPDQANYFLISDDGGQGWETHEIDDGESTTTRPAWRAA